MRSGIRKEKTIASVAHVPDYLRDADLYYSKAFFEWLKGFDFSEYNYRGSNGVELLKRLFYLAKYEPIYVLKQATRTILVKFKKQ